MMGEENRLIYFDCFSGASGDMLLGALVDAGLPLDALEAELSLLPLDGYRLSARRTAQHGISGTKFDVLVQQHDEKGHAHPHRHLSDIEALLDGSGLPATDIERSRAVFRRLAKAEARVHGTTIEEVHFHEVGAIDSIVDIVGFVIGLRLLGIEAAFASPLPLGTGFVQTEHGRLPVPAPATLQILSEAGAPTLPGEVQGELVTPTGAALLCESCQFQRPAMHLHAAGYGFGSRQMPTLNALRAWVGVAREEQPRHEATDTEENVALLECNIDDMTPEHLGYVMRQLLEAGALDVWFTPIYMKKNRPAVLLSLLAHPADQEQLSRLLLRETSTLGIRYQTWKRRLAGRQSVLVTTPWGDAHAKLKILDGAVIEVSPEFDDCERLARLAGIAISRVYDAVKTAYHDGHNPRA